MRNSLLEWADFVKTHPETHILQMGQWGDLKTRFGWSVERIANGENGAQILFRHLPGKFTIGYIPKGPIGSIEPLLNEIDELCHEKHTIFLKVEPDHRRGEGDKTITLLSNWLPSHPFQPRRTVILSLVGSEDELLGRMKQKTRYNIRLAEKKELVIKKSENIREFYELVKETSSRDGFGVHNLNYYQMFYDLFHPIGNCELVTAYYKEQPLASLMVAKSGEMGYYMYGASSNRERNRMPAYFIQWEAMKWAKEQGCKYYDMWGIPDLEEDELEESFTRKNAHEGLWGVYRFKRGFGGESQRSVGAWDRVYKKGLYKVFELVQKVRGTHGE